MSAILEMKNLKVTSTMFIVFLMVGLVSTQGLPAKGGPKDADKGEPKNEDKGSGTDHLGPCFAYSKCGSTDEEARKTMDACMATMESWAAIAIIEGIDKSELYTFNAKMKDEALDEFCAIETDTQLTVFDEAVRVILDLYSSHCSTPSLAAKCDFWNAINECVTPYLDQLHDEEKCGCDE